jgi:hypothetical protein
VAYAGRLPIPRVASNTRAAAGDSRWHLIDQWPGAADHRRQILCQIIGHRRIYADSRRHRQYTYGPVEAASAKHSPYLVPPHRRMCPSRLRICTVSILIMHSGG